MCQTSLTLQYPFAGIKKIKVVVSSFNMLLVTQSKSNAGFCLHQKSHQPVAHVESGDPLIIFFTCQQDHPGHQSHDPTCLGSCSFTGQHVFPEWMVKHTRDDLLFNCLITCFRTLTFISLTRQTTNRER